MRFVHSFGLAVLSAMVVIPASAEAQQPRGKIAPDAARSAALARVPNGTVAATQLKVERGTLVYIYDIAAPGRPGLEEVEVSAVDGQVVSVQHLGGGPSAQAARPGPSVADRNAGPAPPR